MYRRPSVALVEAEGGGGKTEGWKRRKGHEAEETGGRGRGGARRTRSVRARGRRGESNQAGRMSKRDAKGGERSA